jgi:hypothetical protein
MLWREGHDQRPQILVVGKEYALIAGWIPGLHSSAVRAIEVSALILYAVAQ